MVQTQRMRKATAVHDAKIHKRGMVPTTLKKESNPYPVGPVLLGLFIFVVCGSALFEILQAVRTRT